MSLFTPIIADQMVRRAEDAAGVLTPMFHGLVSERLGILHLDARWRLIEARQMETGDDPECLALPLREIIADTMRLGSAALVIAHNHPSGDPHPSRTDLDATRALADLLRPIGIRLHDHLIFAGPVWRSLRNMGLL